VDTGEFTGCTVQYNLLDRRHEEGMRYAAARGLAVAVMGPVGGGRLAGPSAVLRDADVAAANTAELALRFVLANADVACALSGMSTAAQLRANVGTASREAALTASELAALKARMAEFQKLADLYCSGCDYCMPCPENIPISRIFALYNLARVYELDEAARRLYGEIGKTGFYAKMNNAGACNECGQCADKCPQKLDVPTELAAAHRVLARDDD
jgi:predicted aldo/keto reductase-like oxidoreductase